VIEKPPVEQAGSSKAGSSKAEPVPVNDIVTGKDKDSSQRRVEELIGRLEDLERKRTQDSQTEILMFVGTGLFILLSFELFARR
jgi:hypothetical protein